MNNTITMTDLFKARTRYKKLVKDIREHGTITKNSVTFFRDDIDSMRAERIALENKFRLTAKVVKERNVRLEYSHGATKPEKKTMTYIVVYNPLKDYGFFETYSDCGEYYAEGGLWFKEGELTDYDGCFSLDNIIRKQLDSWGLDTSYLD